jgi:hypothetical protein
VRRYELGRRECERNTGLRCFDERVAEPARRRVDCRSVRARGRFGLGDGVKAGKSVNLGLLGFNAYETMFNLTTGNVGFVAIIPEPSAGLLPGVGACVLCAAHRKLRG